MSVAASRFAGAREASSLSDHAYLVIRNRILKGELPLGAGLSRRKLAAELGMSLLPVAEALQRLEGERLVESRPRVGTRVCVPTAKVIRERYEVREALETHAARLFAQNGSMRERMELEKMADHIDAMFNRCFAGGDNDPNFLFAVHSLHMQFHLRIAECTGCETLREAIEKNQVLIFNWLYDVASHRPPLPPRFHRDLIDAINKGNPEEADAAMRRHIRYGRDYVVSAIGPEENARDGPQSVK